MLLVGVTLILTLVTACTQPGTAATSAPAATTQGCIPQVVTLSSRGDSPVVAPLGESASTSSPAPTLAGLQLRGATATSDGLMIIGLWASLSGGPGAITIFDATTKRWQPVAHVDGSFLDAVVVGSQLVARANRGLVVSPAAAWQPAPLATRAGDVLIPLAGGQTHTLVLVPGVSRFEQLVRVDVTSGAITVIADAGAQPSEVTAMSASGSAVVFARGGAGAGEVVTWTDRGLTTEGVTGRTIGLGFADTTLLRVFASDHRLWLSRGGAAPLELVTTDTANRAVVLAGPRQTTAIAFLDGPQWRTIQVDGRGRLTFGDGIPVSWSGCS